jgi:hypothetical protein
MHSVRIPQLLRGHMVIFANSGLFHANLAVAKNCAWISRERLRFSTGFGSGFKPIPDEEGTESFRHRPTP